MFLAQSLGLAAFGLINAGAVARSAWLGRPWLAEAACGSCMKESSGAAAHADHASALLLFDRLRIEHRGPRGGARLRPCSRR